MTKSRAFAAKSGQDISSSVGVTKSKAFAARFGQIISSSVGVTKVGLSRQNLVKIFLVL